jgi:hypothetical protein
MDKCEICLLKYWVSSSFQWTSPPNDTDPDIGTWHCVMSKNPCSVTKIECQLTANNLNSFSAAILQAIAGEGSLALIKKGEAALIGKALEVGKAIAYLDGKLVVGQDQGGE